MANGLSRDALVALLKLAVTSANAYADRVDLLVEFASACRAADDAETAHRAIEEAIGLLDEAAGSDEVPEAWLADSANRVGRLLRSAERTAEARRLFERAIRLAEVGNARVTLGAAWYNLGETWEHDGNHEQALESYRVSARFEVFDRNRFNRLVTLRALARAEARSGGVAASARAAAEGRRLLLEAAEDRREDPIAVARQTRKQGLMLEELGRPAEAREVYTLGTTLLEGSSEVRHAVRLWCDIADTWETQQRPARVLESVRTAARLAAAGDDRVTHAETLVRLASAASDCGERTAFEEACREATVLLEQAERELDPDDRGVGAIAHRLGRCAEAGRSPSLARRAYELALRRFEATGQRGGVAVAWIDIGDTWSDEEQGERALASYRSGIAYEIPDSIQRADALMQLAEAEAKWGDSGACDERLAESVETLRAAFRASDADDREIRRAAERLRRIASESGRPAVARDAAQLAGSSQGWKPSRGSSTTSRQAAPARIRLT